MTSVPGVAAARVDAPRVGAALLTGANSAGTATPSATPAPTVLTKRRRVRPTPGTRREPEDATLTTFPRLRLRRVRSGPGPLRSNTRNLPVCVSSKGAPLTPRPLPEVEGAFAQSAVTLSSVGRA